MFSSIRKTFGIVTAKQLPDEIFVDGVPGHFITNDISSLWRTSKISNNMFNKVTRNTFSIPNFFAVDLIYMLESIIGSKKRLGTSKQTAQKIIDALKESTWLGNLYKEHDDILDFSKVDQFWKKPLDFQQEFLDKYNKIVPMYNLKGYLLGGTAGSGKTYNSLLLSEMLLSDHVIVVCPPNATWDVWYKSISNPNASEFRVPRKSWVIGGNEPYRGEKYLISHYEALGKLLEVAKKLKGKITVILDESHNLNNDESLRSKLFIQLCDVTQSDNVIWCSGTPIKAMGSETITFFRTVDKNFNDALKDKYKKIYGKDAKKALDILSNRLGIVMHVVEKKQLKLLDPIMLNYPVKAENSEQFTLDKIKAEMIAFISERTKYYSENYKTYNEHYKKCLALYEKTIKSEAENKEYELYKKIISNIMKTRDRYDKSETAYCNKFEQTKVIPVLPKEDKELFLNAKSVVKYVELKIQGECLGRILGKRRMQCAKLIAENLNFVELIESTDKKTVVFTSYVEVVERVSEMLTTMGLSPAVVYAKTNHMLSSIIDRYEKIPEVNPLIATYNSLSTAVPLTMADVMVMVNSPFRDYILQQAISRIHRLGANTQTYVYMASLDTGTSPNLSTRSIDILKWSQSQVSAIMGIEVPFQINEDNVAMESMLAACLEGNQEFIISLEKLEANEIIL